jgi:hypothetical protein
MLSVIMCNSRQEEILQYLECAYLVLVHFILRVGRVPGSLQILQCGAELLGQRRGLLYISW